MTYLKQWMPGILGLALTTGVQVSAVAADGPAGFSIMSEEEISAHRAVMAGLKGSALEEYRDAQYRQLRIRAQEHGYSMPADPPWAGTEPPHAAADAEPTPAAIAEQTAANEAAQRHAEMRDKLEARRAAMDEAPDTDVERAQEAADARQEQVEAQGERAEQPAPDPAPAIAAEAVTKTAPAVPAQPPAPAEPLPETAAAPDASAETAALVIDPAMPPRPPGPPAAPVPPPHFAPAEETVKAPPPVLPPYQTTLATETVPPVSQRDTAGTDDSTPAPEPAVGQADPSSETMTAYREAMRARFDEYMQERQARHEEQLRLRREQRAAAMEQGREQINRNRFQPYPYPGMPNYGPRYPDAYPGYLGPYWQPR